MVQDHLAGVWAEVRVAERDSAAVTVLAQGQGGTAFVGAAVRESRTVQGFRVMQCSARSAARR